MKSIPAVFLVVLCSVLLTACGQPTMDAGSKESIRESGSEIYDYLVENEDKVTAREFRDSVKVVAAYVIKETDVSGLDLEETEKVLQEALEDALDGKTGTEIIETAESYISAFK